MIRRPPRSTLFPTRRSSDLANVWSIRVRRFHKNHLRGFIGRLVLNIIEEIRQRPEMVFCKNVRSEEHTSELQSQSNIVCRLLLEKKKNIQRLTPHQTPIATS